MLFSAFFSKFRYNEAHEIKVMNTDRVKKILLDLEFFKKKYNKNDIHKNQTEITKE